MLHVELRALDTNNGGESVFVCLVNTDFTTCPNSGTHGQRVMIIMRTMRIGQPDTGQWSFDRNIAGYEDLDMC